MCNPFREVWKYGSQGVPKLMQALAPSLGLDRSPLGPGIPHGKHNFFLTRLGGDSGPPTECRSGCHMGSVTLRPVGAFV